MKIVLPVSFVLLVFCSSLNVSADSFLSKGVPSVPDHVAEVLQKPNFSDLAKLLSPSVVNISVEAKETEAGDEEAEPLLRRGGPATPLRSVGSGMIVTVDGYIVTNNHVIENARRVVVRLLDDRRDYDAKIIGVDPQTDLALMKISARRELPAVFFGDSEEIEVGEWVLAIGNQFQLGQTVTAGIVSAKSRKVHARRSGPYDAFIQTDASINPGSSGGPLFNTQGQVVGINTAIYSPGRGQFGSSGFNIGIGFAIPANLATSIITQLKETGEVVRGQLGVMIQPVTTEVASALGLEGPRGALVADIAKGSAAEKAKFKRGDVILSYDGQDILDHDDLPLLVANTAIGSTIDVEVVRRKQKKVLRPAIIRQNEKIFEAKLNKPTTNDIGVIVQEVTKALASSLGMIDFSGVLVNTVEQNSFADKAGIVRGDIIEEIDGREITDIATFEKVLTSLITSPKIVLVRVRRGSGTRYLTLSTEIEGRRIRPKE